MRAASALAGIDHFAFEGVDVIDFDLDWPRLLEALGPGEGEVVVQLGFVTGFTRGLILGAACGIPGACVQRTASSGVIVGTERFLVRPGLVLDTVEHESQTDGDAQVDPTECAGLDAANLMFWQHFPGEKILSPQQVAMLQASPAQLE